MSTDKSISCHHLLKAIFAGCFILLFASCNVVRKYPSGKPFVYKTNINLIGDFTNDEKNALIDGLEGQLDDSMKARRVDKVIFRVLKNPPVYDSTNADKSVIFMRALLNSLGYFNDSIGYQDTIIQESADQYRTTITFHVKPRKQVKLDTIIYNLGHADLQKLTDSTQKQAFIKQGDAFAKVPISAELDRLTELYRNNGYLRFTRDELVGVWDTVDVALLKPSLDPFEQLRQLQELRDRRNNPKATLEIRLRNVDSNRLRKYYNGNVTIYPDYTVENSLDTTLVPKEEIVKGIKVIQFRNKFKAKIFPPNIYLFRDSLYRQRRYLRTINRLNLLGAWAQVNIDQNHRSDQDTVDYVIRLTPEKKYSFTTNVEGSINQSAISGTLFGIGYNVNLQNRNFAKASNLANTNVRYGIEFGNSGSDQFIQTQQVSLSHNIIFPRAILLDKFIKDNRKDNWRTFISGSLANTERRILYNLTTVNGSFGWEYQLRRASALLTVKILNIEYSFLHERDSLKSLISSNPSLRNVFNDGFICSVIGNLTITGGKKNNLNIFRANFEGSPWLASTFRNRFLDTHLYRFIKVDAEFARLIRKPKSSIALRFFAGVGLADPFNSTVNKQKTFTLPFFKQYFSGGPNSMRAWPLRRLGPGSSTKDFEGAQGTPDRYGDVQLEANGEFRFPIARPFGVKLNGALFADIGNVWLLKKTAGPSEEVFNFGRLGQDIAVGAGAGLRVDLNFFVLRFDYSYRVKDPSPSLANAAVQNKWFGYQFFKGDQFQLGIGYPFIF